MRGRSLGVLTEWLGGTARRWVALVGLAATALGIVSFALSEDISWAWLAIGSLLLLAVSLGSELWMVQHRMAAHQAPLLDRAIADGHALLTISDHTSFVMQWDRHWRPETYEMLRREFGLSAALDFADAMDSLLRETGRQDPRAWGRRTGRVLGEVAGASGGRRGARPRLVVRHFGRERWQQRARSR